MKEYIHDAEIITLICSFSMSTWLTIIFHYIVRYFRIIFVSNKPQKCLVIGSGYIFGKIYGLRSLNTRHTQTINIAFFVCLSVFLGLWDWHIVHHYNGAQLPCIPPSCALLKHIYCSPWCTRETLSCKVWVAQVFLSIMVHKELPCEPPRSIVPLQSILSGFTGPTSCTTRTPELCCLSIYLSDKTQTGD